MYCTLIKKVPVNQCTHLTTIAANSNSNCIGLGGADGFVKVVLSNSSIGNQCEIANSQVQFNLTQTLQFHKVDMQIVIWNDLYNKLTTCDKSGVNVVWQCRPDGEWEREMINQRQGTTVADMKWSKQGNYICFIYQDGNASVGTVEGNLTWANDLKKKLYLIEWSPDGSNILFAVKGSNVIVVSVLGQELGELELEPSLKKVPLATITWWTNSLSLQRSITLEKHLLLAFENGVVCLYDNEGDLEPVIITTILGKIIKAEWNLTGDVFGLCGILKGDNNPNSCLVFYSADGDHIRTLKTPDSTISFGWISNSTQIVLETSSVIYFALVKPKYKWCYFSETLVYSYLKDEHHYTTVFWDMKKNRQKHFYVRNMLEMTASKDFCCVTTKCTQDTFLIVLNNSQGAKIDTKTLNIEPVFIAMNDSYILVTDKHYVYIWQFRAFNARTTDDEDYEYHGQDISVSLLKKKAMKEIVFFIDEAPNMKSLYNSHSFQPNKRSKDPITSIHITIEFIYIACHSGKLLKYSLSDMSLAEKMTLDSYYTKIGTSPQGQFFWGIDHHNYVSIWKTETRKGKWEKVKYERKDVWSLIWSDEEDLNFALFEKSKLNVIKKLDVDYVVTFNGYLGAYSNNTITLVRVEELMYKPWERAYQAEDIITKIDLDNTPDESELKFRYHDKKSEGMIKQKRGKDGDEDDNDNDSQRRDLSKKMTKKKQEAEEEESNNQVLQRKAILFDEEEELVGDNAGNYEVNYEENERNDIVVLKAGKDSYKTQNLQQKKEKEEELAKKAVQQSRIIQLHNQSQYYTKEEETLMKNGKVDNLFDQWFSTKQYDKALFYCNNSIDQKNQSLMSLGSKFEEQGLCEEAVACYCKFGDEKKAIDTCIKMNRWNLAVEIAEKHNLFESKSMLEEHGNILTDKHKQMELACLYHKSHRHIDATKVIAKVGEDFHSMRLSPLIIKKIYVLAALEMQPPKTKAVDTQMIKDSVMPTIQEVESLDMLKIINLYYHSEKMFYNPWKGAEAFHFYMLCQRQLYNKKIKEAFKTSLRLILYEKELTSKEIYCLIALCAFLNKSYNACSIALLRLENLPYLPEKEREKYSQLAMTIFNIHKPEDGPIGKVKCPAKKCGNDVSELDVSCKKCGTNFSACVVSGQSIFDKDYFKCKRCKNKSIKKEMLKTKLKHCPLCHKKLI